LTVMYYQSYDVFVHYQLEIRISKRSE